MAPVRHMWRPIAEERAACAEDEARRVKVRDMVEWLRAQYRMAGCDDPTRDMVNGLLTLDRWEALAEATGHREPSATTRVLVLDCFPEEGDR